MHNAAADKIVLEIESLFERLCEVVTFERANMFLHHLETKNTALRVLDQDGKKNPYLNVTTK